MKVRFISNLFMELDPRNQLILSNLIIPAKYQKMKTLKTS